MPYSEDHYAGQDSLVIAANALTGRATPVDIAKIHVVNGNSMFNIPDGMEMALFAMGCFWGAERVFWQLPGVYSTAVGYSGGYTPNPTYREVCSGQTSHAEVVRVVFDPNTIYYSQLLTIFWEHHNPTQGMRQGNDIGTQYRSAIYAFTPQQKKAALNSKQRFQQAMQTAGDNRLITTEILDALPFYYAEDSHQQYLYKNPNGYCGIGGIGICLPSE